MDGAANPEQVRLTALLEGWPDAVPALIYRDAPVAAETLAAGAVRAAQALAALGIGAGDRVALWLPNCPAWLEVFFGCARLGAIAVSVNTRFRSAEVQDIVGRSGARALVMWPGFKGIDFLSILADVDPDALDGLETIITYGEDDGRGSGAAAADPGPNLGWSGRQRLLGWDDFLALGDGTPVPDVTGGGTDGCAIFTTSGTTRAPKFVLHSHASAGLHGQDVSAALGYSADDAVMLLAIPLCGVYGFCQMMAGLAARRPTVLMPFFDAGEAAALIGRHSVTHMNATDDMVFPMVAAGQVAGDATNPFPSLRECGFASFNGDPEAVMDLGEETGICFTGRYGMSEVQALFSAQPTGAARTQRVLGGGIPVSAAADVRVRDPESGELLPPGEPGELEITGPSLMAGYFGNPEATAAAMTADGYIRSGDLGHLADPAAGGGFVFLSRMGDAMRLGGFLVSPAEITGRIEEMDGIAEAQVVAVTVDGKPRAVAFVRAETPGQEPVAEDEIIAHCRAGLAAFKVPARVGWLAQFPVTESANGTKVQRGRLRDMAVELVGGENSGR